jgi:hypothetical protein
VTSALAIITQLHVCGRQKQISLPVWRLGEFLLRTNDLGALMFEDGYQVHLQCTWQGLKGRRLYVHPTNEYLLGGQYKSAQDTVTSNGAFSQQTLRDLLPEVLKTLLSPLYQHFSFFQPDEDFYARELGRLTKGRF